MTMISLLTEDMSNAIDCIDMSKQDQEIIRDILYQERQNKERAWSSDAEKYIIKLIDDNVKEGATE